MRRFLGCIVVFGLGLGAGMLIMPAMLTRSASTTESQRRVVAALNRPAVHYDESENPMVSAVRHIEPAVVNIDTVGRTRKEDEEDPVWNIGREVRGKGSGVILSADGYIVTNKHVIDDASRIRVTLPGGQWYYARRIGSDPQTDLAVIRIQASELPAAELGDSDQLAVGEWAIAVGNPLGLGSTITVGVVSALNRKNLQIDEGRRLDGAIQTDAAINRGNSGGALANSHGQLIGINTAILSSGPGGGSIGLGFAIPVNTVRRVVRDIIQKGDLKPQIAQQPWLGIQFGPVPETLAQKLGQTTDRGVLVERILPSSPASRSSLKPEDIILSIDSKPIGDLRDVREAVLQRRIGETAVVRVLRPTLRRELDVPVKLQARPEGPGEAVDR